MNGRVVVSQLGARMDYAVPRILNAHGALEHFYTDICATKGWPRLVGQVPPRFLPTGSGGSSAGGPTASHRSG